MTLAQAQTTVDRRDDLRGRLGDRHDDDVLRCWIKIVGGRQGDLFAVRSAAAGGSAECPAKASGTAILRWRRSRRRLLRSWSARGRS
jgi:hypothetical protein